MSIRIKFCGLRALEDADAALRCGADLVGLNFVPESPRCISRELGAEISNRVGGGAQRVALFQNAPAEDISATLAEVPVDLVQFHGDESPEFVAQFGMPTIKALKGAEPSLAESYPDSILLVDHPSGRAGAGESWDWSEARSLVERGFPVLLAGGLSPENVASALAEFRDAPPFGVDVASGVESAGRKDPERMLAFVRAVRRKERLD